MKHRHVLRMLNDYADGLLGEELKTAVDKHLSLCRSCSEELQHIRSVREKIGQLQKLSAPPGFLESVHRRLETDQRSRFSFRKPYGRLRVVVPAGMAALATAAIAFIFVLNVMEPRREMREMAAGDRPETLVEREKASAEDLETAVVGDHTDEDVYKEELKGAASLEEAALQEKLPSEHERAPAAVKRAAPEVVRDRAEPPVISLVLFKEKRGTSDGEAFGEEVRAGGVKSRTQELAAAEEDGVNQMAEGLSVEETTAQELPAPSAAPGNMYTTVKQMVLDVGGKILSIDYGEKDEIPQSMVVEIPIHAVDMFVDDLMQYSETNVYNEVILPEELSKGTYRRRGNDDMKAFTIRISFE